MEVLAGAGLAGVNSVIKAVTGKSILQHCGKAVNHLRANVLGISADALADKAADKAWKVAEAKLAGPDRHERLLFSRRLEALSTILQRVASSPAVEDESVKMALDNLRCSLQRAFNASGSEDGRRSSEDDIDNYKQDLQLAFAVANHDEICEMHATENSFKYDPYDSDDQYNQEASLLGWGSFGATHTMRNVDDGQLYAVKLINIKQARVPFEDLQQEASRLAKLHHPNIVRYYTSFKKKPFFAIVTELLTGGSLLERIDGAAGPLPAGQIKRWTIQIASALAHMHAQRMQHRDLKPDNVLFDARGDARLIDLGLAKIVVAKSKVSSAGGKNAVGAVLYRSPEKALGRAYDAKDDIWALGCMVAGAATGKSLEDRSASGAGLFALSRDKVKSLVDEAASSTFGELVAATLQINPIKRPAAEIIELALRSGKSLAAAARDGTIFEEEDDDATSDALDDVPYAEVVGVEPLGDAPSDNVDSLGKERTKAFMFTNDSLRQVLKEYFGGKRREVEKIYGLIGTWDVSQVTDMSGLFKNPLFNEPIGTWNTSNVKTMSYMFCGAECFNQNLNKWNISRVRDMSYMFSHASNFNHFDNISEWDLENVPEKSSMIGCGGYI